MHGIFLQSYIIARRERPIKEDIVLALCRAFLPPHPSTASHVFPRVRSCWPLSASSACVCLPGPTTLTVVSLFVRCHCFQINVIYRHSLFLCRVNLRHPDQQNYIDCRQCVRYSGKFSLWVLAGGLSVSLSWR